MIITIPQALDTFVHGFTFTRSFTHPYIAKRVGPSVEGEAMALINGSPCATAFVTECALMATQQLDLALKVMCLSIEAFGAPLQHFDPALQQLWRDPFDQKSHCGHQHLAHRCVHHVAA